MIVIIALVKFRPSAARRAVSTFTWAIITYVMSLILYINNYFIPFYILWLATGAVRYLLIINLADNLASYRHAVTLEWTYSPKLYSFRQFHESSTSFDFTTKYTYIHLRVKCVFEIYSYSVRPLFTLGTVCLTRYLLLDII